MHQEQVSSTEPAGSFASLGLAPELVEALARQGIVDPFPIQALTIRDALAGRDVCGKAKTGSGKTLAFGLPLLQRVEAAAGAGAGPRPPKGLVLVPTRELARQVADVLEPLGRVAGLTLTACYGGTGMESQVKALAGGTDVLVATPGRLIDLRQRGAADLSRCSSSTKPTACRTWVSCLRSNGSFAISFARTKPCSSLQLSTVMSSDSSDTS